MTGRDAPSRVNATLLSIARFPNPQVAAVLSIALLGCAACGGGGNGTPDSTSTPAITPAVAASPTPEGSTLTSDDGMLTLLIPDGAVPAGTEVTITHVAAGELPSDLQELIGSGGGYRLEPDGLTFEMPVTATLTIDRAELDESDDGSAAYVIVSYNETEGRELLDSETYYTLGEDTVEVTAKLAHFSTITRTRGSLRVDMDAGGHRQVVDSPFVVSGSALNLNPAAIELAGADLVGDARLPVQVVDGPNAGTDADLLGNVPLPLTINMVCRDVGPGQYYLVASAVATPREFPEFRTVLFVRVGADVECVEAGQGAEVGFSLGCVHIGPGESQLLAKVRVRGPEGEPLEGALVELAAEGPEGYQMVVQGTTDANGDVEVAFPINRTGTYTVHAISVQQANGELLDPVGSGLAPLDFTVGEVCTPPP